MGEAREERLGRKHALVWANRVPDSLFQTRKYARKLLVDIAKRHFAALQKNILQSPDPAPISGPYGGFRCTFLDVSSLNLAVPSGTAFF